MDSSSNVIQVIKSSRLRCTGHVVCIGERRGAYGVSVGKPEGKRPIERPRHKWEDIKMDLSRVRWGGMDWIDLAQDRERWQAVLNAVMNLLVS